MPDDNSLLKHKESFIPITDPSNRHNIPYAAVLSSSTTSSKDEDDNDNDFDPELFREMIRNNSLIEKDKLSAFIQGWTVCYEFEIIGRKVEQS